jgi:hypothetical protein
MGTNLPNAGAPLGARRRDGEIVLVIIEAPPRNLICARDMRARRESTRLEKGMSTPTDDDARAATNDVVGPRRTGRLTPYRLRRTIGRTGDVAFHLRRSTTVNPARSNIVSVPR